MQPDAPGLLWDAREAGRLVQQFVVDQTAETYSENSLVRSAVERQLTTVGEALNRLSQVDPDTAAGLSDVPKIVGLRNVLVHGYRIVDDDIVWRIVAGNVPTRLAELDGLLSEVTE